MKDLYKTRRIISNGGNGNPGGNVYLIGNRKIDYNLIRLG